MDKEKEIEIFNRLKELEDRLATLEREVEKLIKATSLDFPHICPEIDSDEPIIDG